MSTETNHVLVVHPNPDTSSELTRQLQQLGYNTSTAPSEDQALNLMAQYTFGVILLAASEEVAVERLINAVAASDDLQRTPIVVMASSGQAAEVERYLQLGADDYLLAPYTPNLLNARVRVNIDRKRLRLEKQEQLHQDALVKIEHDLQVARRIQTSFLPSSLPQPAGWEVAARFQPAREVAGDFYDAFMLSQNRRAGFVIGDVVDKGVPAALFMALVRSLTRAFAQQNYSLSWTDVLDDAPAPRAATSRPATRSIPSTGTVALKNAIVLTNNYIIDNHIDLNYFATMFFGLVDPMTGALAYINAGHNPPYIVGADGVIKGKLKSTGPAVGMFAGASFAIDQAELEPGDFLFTYTDGVTEARNAAGEFFTEGRLASLLSEPCVSASALLDRFQAELLAFIGDAVQFDDITMLAVHRLPEA